MRRRDLLAGAAAMLAAGPALPARATPEAEPWPSQTIRLIVPFPPGAANDTLGRAIADQLAPRLGKPVVVDNRSGAGGSLGSTAVARAAPDGHTLLLGHIGTLAVNPAIYPKLAYDPVKDFAPVAMIASVTNVMVVHPSQPFRDLTSLVAFARAHPNKLRYCSAGNGSAGHIVMLAFLQATGVQMEHVPYRGLAQGLTDLVAGVVELTIGGAPTVMPLVNQGLLRAIGVSSPKRMASLPDLATAAETVAPGFDVRPWYGIAAPAGTPPEIVKRLNVEINAILDSPAVKKRLEQEGAEATPMTPEAFGDLIKSEVVRWGDLIRTAGVTVQ
ncbi:tripartite tricarboxylate transporter substrate binding protein [Rhodoplanes sp. TEM]|uniref:Tripartite tricarboxylate transporter substrate binding protein n=1 Tax=Rhodoplanes tepidamans TaxID=200616 RepID=A0ABT5J679_RHOTP|nr:MULTISPECIES: tripartite tricarboxylate transporter substrate binding protein [Rhodoplanes]MDC7785157.1 tripartite tricarboxylate transporter substrate binding protein [Rhodoplanes tepidamans]MDC7982631.1 tripartite tricarboxylate transporter substrate binding protein [Rhodoplanes sp. TEM]MDQ0356649.1 tripartite-type tricarboxylate transporter receptor subunit TctC [Rhodoplanes tepidamans]